MYFASPLVAVVALTTQAMAHGILGEIITDGVRHAAFQTDYIYRKQNGNPTPDLITWATESLDRGYIEPEQMNTLDINCHVNAVPGALTATVAAGGTVDFFWPDWPHNVSPVLTYIASCDGDCSVADKSALKWVKIDEAGYDGQWAAEKLMNNNFTWTTTVPSTIAPGNYVFRNEIINLHSGAEQNGAQLYPQCVNVAITGGGTDKPEGVLGVDLYKPDDAGILFDPYAKGMSTYPLPGPALYTAGDSAPVEPAPVESAPVVVPVESAPVAAPVESVPVVESAQFGNATSTAAPQPTAAAPTFIPTTLATITRSAPGARTRTLATRTRSLGARPTAAAVEPEC